MYFVVTLALKMLIYALVNSAFSGFASLKLHLFIHSLRLWGLLSYFLVSPNSLFSLLLFCRRLFLVAWSFGEPTLINTLLLMDYL